MGNKDLNNESIDQLKLVLVKIIEEYQDIPDNIPLIEHLSVKYLNTTKNNLLSLIILNENRENDEKDKDLLKLWEQYKNLIVVALSKKRTSDSQYIKIVENYGLDISKYEFPNINFNFGGEVMQELTKIWLIVSNNQKIELNKRDKHKRENYSSQVDQVAIESHLNKIQNYDESTEED